MNSHLESAKPSAPARVHLLLAALLWTVVGAALLFFGVRWAWDERCEHAVWWLAASVVVGLLKARFVLGQAAPRMIDRIRARGDGKCIGGFLSPTTWLFVLLMVAAGRLLRGEWVPRFVVGLVYTAVGTALLVASRRVWHAWFTHKTPPRAR